jgi:hypothetical protein
VRRDEERGEVPSTYRNYLLRMVRRIASQGIVSMRAIFCCDFVAIDADEATIPLANPPTRWITAGVVPENLSFILRVSELCFEIISRPK